jgi:hypothetical protein
MMKGSFELWPEAISEASFLQIPDYLADILHPHLCICKPYILQSDPTL